MTIYSGIFNSVNGDRKYNAWWFAKYFATFIGNGVFPNPSSNLQIAAYQNMKVVVKPGSGWIDGYFIYSDGYHVLSLDVADGALKRIDRVVMRLNHLTRKIDLVVKKGTFASSPVAPTLQRDTDYVELALADVLINNGATQITQANITDQRLNKTVCGIVHGTVDQVDTTTIFNQYQEWFKEITGSVAGEVDAWQAVQKQEFMEWFESVKDILEGDVAGNLANRITLLDQKLSTHEANMIRHNNYGVATGTNMLTLTLNPPLTALVEGLPIRFKNTNGNTSGTMTLNVDGLGAKPIRRNGGIAIPSNYIKAGGVYSVIYDGANFILLDEGGDYGNITSSDVRQGKTYGTVNGLGTGTLNLSQLTPSNIRRGVTIDGVSGTIDPLLPGNFEVIKQTRGYGYEGNKPKRYCKIGVGVSAIYRVSMQFGLAGSTPNKTAYAQIYRNGKPYGTIRTLTDYYTNGSWEGDEDLYFASGDTIEAFLWNSVNTYPQTNSMLWYMSVKLHLPFTDFPWGDGGFDPSP